MDGAEAPLFLLGAARSGTSLLYKALCLNDDAAWISNWVRRCAALPQLAVANRVARRLPHISDRVWFGDDGTNAYVYGAPREPWRRAFPMPVEGEPLYARCGIGQSAGSQDEAGPTGSEQQRLALRRSLRAVQRYSGGRRLVLKRIANNRRVPLLAATFPDARFVDLVRDGRAVAYSLSHVDWWADSTLSWYGGSPRRWAAEGNDPWLACARNWVEELVQIESGLSGVPRHQVLAVTYEGFVGDPVGTLRDVADFAGLAVKDTWLERLGRLRFPDKNERWRQALGPDAIATIEAVQRDLLERHGYV